jgi:hypothetical protein
MENIARLLAFGPGWTARAAVRMAGPKKCPFKNMGLLLSEWVISA